LRYNTGDVRGCIASGERAAEYARVGGDPVLIARAMTMASAGYAAIGQLDRADASVREVESLLGSLPPREIVAHYIRCAFIASLRGDNENAIRMYDDVANLYRSLGAPIVNANVFLNTAEIEHGRGNTTRAIAIARDGLRMFARSNIRGRLLANLAGYLLAVDDVAAARIAAEESLAAGDFDDPDAVIYATPMLHLALVHALGGDLARGARLLGHVLSRYADAGVRAEHTEVVTIDRLRALLAAAPAPDDMLRYEAEGRDLNPRQARDLAVATAEQLLREGDPTAGLSPVSKKSAAT
jgi:ATP/maltotriose-dependent transcriptional regulator MalT